MAKYIVEHSGPLHGEVVISGAKNAVLPIMAAAMLTDEPCEIMDVPGLRDVDVMCGILKDTGVDVDLNLDTNILKIHAGGPLNGVANPSLAKMMRASILMMAPLLMRTGRAKVALPGGCAIGKRPIDLHLKGFEILGAEISFDDIKGSVEATRNGRLKGDRIYLDYPSVGATENIMIAAVLAEGVTIIENVAQEPEIVDLANFLNKMGAKVRGAGTDTIRIEGVEKLHGTIHQVIPDRIETGTFMVAAAITRGDLLIRNMMPDHVRPIIAKLRECGVLVEENEDEVRVCAENRELVGTNIKTMPYPGFPTDMQSQFMAFLTTVKGESNVIETVFENRFMHVHELNLMGADIRLDDRNAIIPGDKKLTGEDVVSTDLRAGAALVLAAMVAEGATEISEIRLIERGYSDFVEKLKAIGAKIQRVDD